MLGQLMPNLSVQLEVENLFLSSGERYDSKFWTASTLLLSLYKTKSVMQLFLATPFKIGTPTLVHTYIAIRSGATQFSTNTHFRKLKKTLNKHENLSSIVISVDCKNQNTYLWKHLPKQLNLHFHLPFQSPTSSHSLSQSESVAFCLTPLLTHPALIKEYLHTVAWHCIPIQLPHICKMFDMQLQSACSRDKLVSTTVPCNNQYRGYTTQVSHMQSHIAPS